MTHAKEPLILRCLKTMAAIDWKALALVLAALAGFGGAIWNKVDALIEHALAARTQQGSYEVLAAHIEELDSRLDALEAIKSVGPAPTRMSAPVTTAKATERVKRRRLPAFSAILDQARTEPPLPAK